MSASDPSRGPGWAVVRVVDLSPSRRRIEYVFAGGYKRSAVVDSEADTPDLRARLAAALLADSYRVARPGGPQAYTPPPATTGRPS